MNYRAFVKQQLMSGKMHRSRGFGISTESHPKMQLSNYHGGGTISHRAVVGPLLPNFGSLSVSSNQKSGSGSNRKIYDDEPKAGKGLSKKFNSLKFNF